MVSQWPGEFSLSSLPECATDAIAQNRPTNCESSTNSSACRPSTLELATPTPALGSGGPTSRATLIVASSDTRPCLHITRWPRESPAQRCARSTSGKWCNLVDRHRRERNDNGWQQSRLEEDEDEDKALFISPRHPMILERYAGFECRNGRCV